MKNLLVAVLFAVPELACAQALLEFRGDHAFPKDAIEAAAERNYRTRLRSLSRDGRLDADHALLSRLRNLLEGLERAARIENPGGILIGWELHTCRRCDETASSMAGGRLLIGEEFVAKFGFTDSELAYLLAHEMAHVLAEHTREFASIARYIVDNGRNRRFEDIQRELDENYIVNLRMSDFYARQELEADYIGFVLGARSGHDPEAMLGMLKKLHREPAGAFSTHPSEEARIQRASSMLQTAYRIRELGNAPR